MMMDPKPGDELPAWAVEAVSAEKMKTMAALLGDPNTIHFDPAAVAALGMGDRVVNQGPTNLAYVMNMLSAWCGDPALLRRIDVRFLGNVLAGDRVTAGGRVVERAGAEVTCDVWLDVEGSSRALAGTAVVTWPGS